MIVNANVKQVPIDEVQPHPDNPRKGNVEVIAASIRANGFYGAVVAQQTTGRILVGNHRWQAARQAGLKKIPVVFVDVDDEQAKRIMLADNRTADLSSYDSAALVKLLSTVSLDGTGYTEEDLDNLVARLDLPAPIEAPFFSDGREKGEASKAGTVHWGFVQWKSTRVRVSAEEVAALDALYEAYLAANRSDVGFGWHLVNDRAEGNPDA